MKKELLIEQFPMALSFEKKTNLTESIEVKENGNTILLKGVPCTILDKKNQNGRIYPSHMMKTSIDQAKDFIDSRSALCQAHDHPEGTFVKPIDASHLVVKAYIEDVPNVGKVLFNDWEILPTSKGKDLAALINANVSFGTSIRGLGNMNGCTVDAYDFLGTDAVGNPSSGTFTRMFERPVVVSVEPLQSKPRHLGEATEISSDDMDIEIGDDSKVTINGEPAVQADVGNEEPKQVDEPVANTDTEVEKPVEEPVQKVEPEEPANEYNVSNDTLQLITGKSQEQYDMCLHNGNIDEFGKTRQYMEQNILDDLKDMGLVVSKDVVSDVMDKYLSDTYGKEWYADLYELTNSGVQKESVAQEELLIDNNVITENNLGDYKMVNVDLSDLPELKQLQKGDNAIAVHKDPGMPERPLEAITAEDDPNKGALKAGPNPNVGYAPEPEDAKKIKYQSYDTNNVLAREKTRLGERCVELAQQLADSRKRLAEQAEKYNEAQNLVKSLVGQLTMYKESLDNKDPEAFKADYEKQISDLKESFTADTAKRKEKSVNYITKVITEAAEKHTALAEEYEGKLKTKDSEIADLNTKLTESASAAKIAKAESYAEIQKLKESSKVLAKEAVDKVSNKSAELSAKLIKESAEVIKSALAESNIAHKKLTDEIEAQKALFEKVNECFDIACVINDSLSEALTEECAKQCGKKRVESVNRRMRGHR